MSTSNLRMLVSRVPKVSLKGLAYLASANFLARAIILLRHYIITSFHSEMILIYGATLDTRILLFFQAIYMLPMFLLGILVFYGIERESFNLVLYPTLMLVFLILIRYGSEAALLVIHWEDHKLDQTPEVVFALLQDIIFIIILLLYVYVCLAFTPIKPTPLELIEGGNTALVSAAQGTNLLPPQADSKPTVSPIVVQQPHLLSPNQIQTVGPDAQGFNHSLRRSMDQMPKETLVETKPTLGQVDPIKQTNLPVGSETESGYISSVSGVKETDLDAVPTTSSAVSEPANTEPAPAAVASEEPTVTVKLNKSRIAAARKKLAEEAQKEQEKPKEPEADFWGNLNGDTSSKTEGFKTTSV